MRLERLFDAPPEVVFDAYVGPDNQAELHGSGDEGWTLHRNETDVRVGGTSVYAMGRRVSHRTWRRACSPWSNGPTGWCSRIPAWGRVFETEITMTFEDRDGKTLLTMVQTGFETEADRDSFMTGWPEYLETLRRVVTPELPGTDDTLKARHDTA